jgi:DNA-3-methyladenine glycosylase
VDCQIPVFRDWKLLHSFGYFWVVTNFNPLPQTFYRPSAETVAPRLLGHWLVRRTKNGFCGGPIVETEAYLVDDPASHGFVGQTSRNRVLYGPPGYAYVYFIYGTYFCVNAVCREAGHAEAVLIRAIEAEFGVEQMMARRPVGKSILLTNGPGKLCVALDIDRKLDGENLCIAKSDLFIAANPEVDAFRRKRGPVVTTTRIGITKAAHLPLRFYLAGSAFISKPAPQSIAPPRPKSRAPTKR